MNPQKRLTEQIKKKEEILDREKQLNQDREDCFARALTIEDEGGDSRRERQRLREFEDSLAALKIEVEVLEKSIRNLATTVVDERLRDLPKIKKEFMAMKKDLMAGLAEDFVSMRAKAEALRMGSLAIRLDGLFHDPYSGFNPPELKLYFDNARGPDLSNYLSKESEFPQLQNAKDISAGRESLICRTINRAGRID